MSAVKYTASERHELAEFERLCKRVDKLDSGAAKYLRRLARGWNPQSLRSCGVRIFTPDADISKCFMWDGAGMPPRLWASLHTRLEESP